MSVQSAEPAGASGAERGWTDEIDLGRWARAVGRRWPVLLAIFLLAIVAALAGRWLLGRMGEPVYQAGADVAIVRMTSELTFDERFTTTAGEVPMTNIAARRSALLGLAASPALAVPVIEELGGALSESEQDPAVLAAAVQASLVTGNGRPGDSDLIRIAATASTPEKAAAIASAWARAFVQQANRVYGQVPDEMIASIQEERASAEQVYAAAQSELQSFMAGSRMDEVFRQVTAADAALNSLYQARQDTLDAVLAGAAEAQGQLASAVLGAEAENRSAAYVQEQEGRRQLLSDYLDALYGGQSEVFRQRAQQDIQLLQDAYTRRLQTLRALDGARTLRDQVAAVEIGETAESAGEISGGSVLVLEYLKLQALTQLTDPVAPPQQEVAPAPSVEVRGELPARAQAQQQAQTLAPTVVENTQPVQVYTAASPVQVQLDARAAVDKATLLAEIDALIGTLEARSAELEQQIAAQSARLLDPDRYGDVSEATLGDGQLTAAVQAQYAALMGQGILTPSLSLAGLAAPGARAADAAAAGDEVAALVGTADGAALHEATAPLEARLRALKAEYEALRARSVQLTQARDLALDAYKTVNSKVAELTVTRAAAGSEVRFAAPAVAPANPVSGLGLALALALGAVAGLLAAALYLVVSELRAGSPRGQRA
jgi:capsular polysaccharide biosynthesis protein